VVIEKAVDMDEKSLNYKPEHLQIKNAKNKKNYIK
jgi:hypothetical protein